VEQEEKLKHKEQPAGEKSTESTTTEDSPEYTRVQDLNGLIFFSIPLLV
jgi:hypothetical protein